MVKMSALIWEKQRMKMEINTVDAELGQHGYFTFLYQWVIFTDVINTEVIQKHANNIINIAFVAQQWSPFVMRKDGSDSYSGLSIDALHLLAKAMNFSYRFIEPPDGGWGIQHPNGSWTGLAGLLQRKEADIVAAAFSTTYSRSKVMDFTSLQYFREHRACIYKKPDSRYSMFGGFSMTFDRTVWLCIMSAIGIVAGAMFFNGMRSRDPPFVNASSSFWYAIGTILQQVAAVYSGNLTAHLTVANSNTPFRTYADIARQSDHLVGILGGTSDATFYNETRQDPYKTIGRKIFRAYKVDPTVLSKEIDVHMKRKYVPGGHFAVACDICACCGESCLLEESSNSTSKMKQCSGQKSGVCGNRNPWFRNVFILVFIANVVKPGPPRGEVQLDADFDLEQ
ncbi:hypothetical protein CAPTEDRAFT_185486 [Capitella teleta]|uniref:Ionotropic glutamate receptor L-glutamate and glycine-binding domain-containing protein n=1 Tax=Capitella teleta TaxID=283909 RepID=R7VCZ9_CAPTE|nr:hypothetical protein CAPTEDRAFT_185486 [Capitella teleta]|eukprot:ELU16524.1 hypothetical protein CAPTEDRAFT_185486 [Capitella teleta]